MAITGLTSAIPDHFRSQPSPPVASLRRTRTCDAALGQGTFGEVTIRNSGGYLAVYAVGDLALLAVIGDSGLNIARLHPEARPVTARLSAVLTINAIDNRL
jgi:uncharacterized protein